MKKATLILMVTVFMLTGNVFAQLSDPVIVDQLGVDCEWHYYVHNSLGPRIAVDENGAVHVVYMKSWAAEADTGFALFYKNLTTGTMDTIPPQQPEEPIKPSRAFIGGGRGEAPLFIYYGITTYNFQWGDMPLQAMAKVDADGNVVPLGVQTDKNYYHEPYYALPISMEVDPTGIAHCILTNVGGADIGYWNFDGTNFGEIYAMYFKDPANDVPGKDVPWKYRRNATKGADLAITPDGETVAVGGLHPWSNIDVTLGALGGEIWPDSMQLALDEGSFFFLFDTTNCATGDNLPHDQAKPATDLQLAYDDDGVLHIVYEAAWFSHYLDTLQDASFAARNDENVDKWGGWDWMTTYYYLAGDTNAVYYGSGKPKPQIRYWNSNMGVMANSIDAHTKIAESVYPMPGAEYKWWFKANIDSGVGLWGNRTDCIIAEVDLVINTDSQEGEPKAAVVWEEIGSEPTIIEDSDMRYVGYYRDILVSVTDDFATWTTPVNLTNTPDIDEGEVSVYTDIVDDKVHFVYNSDNLPMSDYFLRWTQTYADKFLSGPTVRANPDDKVNIVYRELDLGVPPYVVPADTIVKIARAANPPVIDGLLDVMWYNAGENRDYVYAFGEETVEDWFDMGLSFRALYDADNLYVFMSVKDETLVRDSGGNWWEDDSFELYIDGDNSKGQSYDGVNDQGLRWTYNEATILDPDPLGWETMAVVRTDHGIDLEVAIPIEKLGITPVAGHKIGIEMQWNEDDDGGARDAKVQHFSTEDQAWQNPSYMGTAELEARTVYNELAVYQTDTAPSIDGEMDDMWFNFPLITSNNYPEVSSGVANLAEGWQDASYTFRTAWDADNLYLFVVVKDETLVRDSGTEFWKDDTIELYLDSDNSKGTSYDGVNDWGFHWRYGETTVFDATLAAGNGPTVDFSPIQQGALFTADGLTLELALPMDFLKLNPEVGTLFGFELDYDDDDDGGERDTKVKYYTTIDESYQNPSTLGTAQLVGAFGTGVADDATVVMDYRLDQNYPNPFNPITTIHYSIKETDLVNLTVFNMLGQKVKTLVDVRQPAGLYVTQWDGKDQFGNTVAGGVYFYQIKSGKFVNTKKMVLLK